MEVLKEQYEKEIVPAMMKKFGYKSIMEVPKLDKVVLNVGLGDVKENPKSLEGAISDLTEITGQKPVITKAKKAIAAFKIRAGVNIGTKVTLRNGRMYDFVYKLFNVALPRVKNKLYSLKLNMKKLIKLEEWTSFLLQQQKLMKRPENY